MTKAKRAVFLDRDNTIIKNDGDLGDPDEVKLVRGGAHVIASLRQLGFQIVVVTNQGGVARGNYTERDVDAVHQRIANLVRESSGGLIDRFYYCPFHPDGNVPEYTREHPWRKPSPGMLLQAAKDLDLDLGECWMVGDAERDVQAGRRAGCKTILITRHPNSVRTAADFRAETLAEAAAIVAQNRTRPKTSPRPIKVGAAITAAEAASQTESPVIETTAASRLVPSTVATGRAMDPQSVPGQSKLVSKMHPRLDDVATTLDDTTAGEIEFVPETEDTIEPLSSPVISDSQASELLARTRDAVEVDDQEIDEDEVDAEDAVDVDDDDDEATEDDEVEVDEDEDEDEDEDDEADDDEEGDEEYEYEYEYEYEEEGDDAESSPAATARTQTPQERVRHLAAGETDPRVFRAINDLASEIRAWRLGTPEFTPARMLVQLVLIGILLLAMAIAIYVNDRTDALIWIGVTLIGQLTLIGLLNVNRR